MNAIQAHTKILRLEKMRARIRAHYNNTKIIHAQDVEMIRQAKAEEMERLRLALWRDHASEIEDLQGKMVDALRDIRDMYKEAIK